MYYTHVGYVALFFDRIREPPITYLTDTLLPSTTMFRSGAQGVSQQGGVVGGRGHVSGGKAVGARSFRGAQRRIRSRASDPRAASDAARGDRLASARSHA